MKVYALLTGRGNNSLKDKNVLELLGHPVLYYPANSSLKCDVFDELFCSSDDDKILSEAQKLKHIPIKRPDELALPTSQHIDCILHAIRYMEEQEYSKPDILVVTLANNVTIKSEWIKDCVEMMKEDMSISAVVPVYEDNDHHPLRAKTVDSNNRLQMYEKVEGEISTNRQDLPTCYFLSHNFWVLNVEQLLNSNGKGQQPWSFMGNNIAYYEIDESIDIHKEQDLIVAKNWIVNNYSD